MKGLLIGVAVVMGCGAPAVATAQSAPRADVAVSGTFVRDSQPMNLKGWMVSGSTRWRGTVSLVGEVGRHTGQSEVTVLTFPARTVVFEDAEVGVSGGLRYQTEPIGGARPFAQVLLGWNRRTLNGTGGSSTWLIQPDLGVDLPIATPVAFRVQLGWRYLMNSSSYRNEFRLAGGLVIAVGG